MTQNLEYTESMFDKKLSLETIYKTADNSEIGYTAEIELKHFDKVLQETKCFFSSRN